MKPVLSLLSLLVLPTLAGCVPTPASTPEPSAPPTQAASPRPTPTPSATPTYASWMDMPQAAGDWSLRLEPGATTALFGEASSGARFTMRCDKSSRRVTLSRAGTANGTTSLTFRTETVERTVSAKGDSAGTPQITAILSGNDPLLDAIALTKGRFAVDSPGLSTLILPAWAEVTRVIEDCR